MPEGIFWLILGMAAVNFASRVAGFLFTQELWGRLGRSLRYLPHGLFAALVATGLPPGPGEAWSPRLVAVAATALAAWRRWPVAAALLFGFAVYLASDWLASLLTLLSL